MKSRATSSVAVILFTALLLALAAAAAGEQSASRPIYVISDLHMGLGRIEGDEGGWHPTEDFRWPQALAGFLAKISPPGEEKRVDLAIAGDFLELWQPPSDIDCEGPNPNYGCSVAQIRQITERVLAAHSAELSDLASFAGRDGNCVHVIPGNHDAALMLDSVWSLLAAKLNAGGGCVTRAESGVWESGDGLVVVEHGHQIGLEANRYRGWPDEIVKRFGGVDYIERPWGERFVQKKFNDEEQRYPLIDNLSPKSAGVRYRFADRGLDGSIEDVALFLKFNLLDTSWRQKGASLGKKKGGVKWDPATGRDLGHQLFALTLAPDDPFRKKLLSGDEEWLQLRQELDALAQDTDRLPDEEVVALCDQLAIQKSSRLCGKVTLGALAQRMFLERGHVVREHVQDRLLEHKRMGVFAYGHTHAFEIRWPAKLQRRRTVSVLNSGAFQRLLDKQGLEALAEAEGLSPIEFIKSGSLEKIAPCYTFVEIGYSEGVADPRVRAWMMDEKDPSGEFADPCGPSCPNVGKGCRRP